MRHINAAGLALIKRYEKLTLEAILTSEGHVTVGYGHVGRGVRLGSKILESEAEALLLADLAWIEEAVLQRVRIELSDNEFSALVSLVFDIGIRQFSESALLKLLNKERKARASEAMTWLERPSYLSDGAGLPGVSRRRCLEQALFLGLSDSD